MRRNNSPGEPATADPLSGLSGQCMRHVTSRLSPEDLCSLAQTSQSFRSITADPGLWRALYFARWEKGPSEVEQQGEAREPESWKSMYIHRDAMELEDLGRTAPESLRDIYLQMVTARRSEPLTAVQVAQLLEGPGTRGGPGVLSDRIAAFRKDRGLFAHSLKLDGRGNNSSTRKDAAACTCGREDSEEAAIAAACPGGCSFVELEPNFWICEKMGHVHECGPEACKERRIDSASEMLVCGITGRCFQPMIGDYEEDDGVGREGDDASCNAGGDWNAAEEGMGGRLGRAFFAGYVLVWNS